MSLPTRTNAVSAAANDSTGPLAGADPHSTYDPLRSFFEAQMVSSDGTPQEGTVCQPVTLSPWLETRLSTSTFRDASAGRQRSASLAGSENAFILSRFLASGGYGEVWESTQRSLDRTIAVKRIREELLDTAEADPRRAAYLDSSFRQEALTMGRLDHPNILPIYDLGADEKGRPLLGMKLVRGQPWSELLRTDMEQMEVHDFLAKHLPILVSVGNAVAFAHSRGIIHRDIKPSQVMVGEFGEVLLMDWGIALIYDTEALRARADEDFSGWPTPTTATSPAGTVAFMAPEQMQETAEAVGPRTDVYLLGGTLYYLLTGKTPHEGSTGAQFYYNALNGIVKPLYDAAREREVPDELADLAMSCLQKEPQHRTGSAREFVQKLQDYLSGAGRRRDAMRAAEEAESTLARSLHSYQECAALKGKLEKALENWPANPRLAELMTRARMAHARMALEHGDLSLARVEADQARGGEEREQLLREIALREHEVQQSQDRFVRTHEKLAATHRRAEELLNFLLGDLRSRLESIGRLDVLDAVGDRVLGYLESIDAEDLDAESRVRRAEALRLLGESRLSQGKMAEAQRAFEESLVIGRELTATEPANNSATHALAQSIGCVGRVKRAAGDMAAAQELFLQQLNLLERLTAAEPTNTEWRFDMAEAHYGMADARAVCGDLEGALVYNTAYRRIMKQLVAEEPARGQWVRSLAGAEADHGWIMKARGDLDGALRQYHLALSMTVELARRDPANPTLQTDVAFFHNKLGWVLEARGERSAAIDHYQTATRLTEAIVDRDPTNETWKRQLAITHVRAGSALLVEKRNDDARHEFRKAAGILQPLVITSPENVWNRHWLARALLGIASAEETAGNRDVAQVSIEDAATQTAELAAAFMATSQGELAPVATHALALVRLGEVERARPIAKALMDKGFHEADVLAEFEKAGIVVGE